MSLKLKKYLFELRENAIRLERTDINGNVDDSFFGKYLKYILCALITLFFIYFTKGGFSDSFISYTSTVLSILIGLFITAIIFSFDKFYQKSDLDSANSKIKLWDTQSYNYSKQFAFITGYNIVLCVFVLILLSFSTLFKSTMEINVFDYIFQFDHIDLSRIFNFFLVCFVLFQRFFVFYWISITVFNTLFIVSSMVKFMTVKIDRQDD